MTTQENLVELKPYKRLIRYVRDGRGNRIGVVVALSNNEIGWSAVNHKKGDTFDKYRGLQIAENRAIHGFKTNPPKHVMPYFADMALRAERYYK